MSRSGALVWVGKELIHHVVPVDVPELVVAQALGDEVAQEKVELRKQPALDSISLLHGRAQGQEPVAVLPLLHLALANDFNVRRRASRPDVGEPVWRSRPGPRRASFICDVGHVDCKLDARASSCVFGSTWVVHGLGPAEDVVLGVWPCYLNQPTRSTSARDFVLPQVVPPKAAWIHGTVAPPPGRTGRTGRIGRTRRTRRTRTGRSLIDPDIRCTPENLSLFDREHARTSSVDVESAPYRVLPYTPYRSGPVTSDRSRC